MLVEATAPASRRACSSSASTSLRDLRELGEDVDRLVGILRRLEPLARLLEPLQELLGALERLFGRAHATCSRAIRPEDPVHEPSRLVGRVALRERDRLVDRDLDRHLAAVELVDRRSAGRSARARRAGRPASPRTPRRSARRARRACAATDSASSRANGSTSPSYSDAERLAGQVPLVEQEERRAPGCPPPGHQPASAGKRRPASSRKRRRVARRSRTPRCGARRRAQPRVVGDALDLELARARAAQRSIADGRSASQTITFAISES